MKVVFLDIDGVLNCAATFTSNETRMLGRYFLDPAMLARLDRIVDATGARIVISSCWRIGDGGQGVARILAAAGLRHADAVVGETSRLGGERGLEIADWMKPRWDVEAFVILDDDNDMGQLTPHLVKTSWLEGLQDQHVEWAIATLGREERQTA